MRTNNKLSGFAAFALVLASSSGASAQYTGPVAVAQHSEAPPSPPPVADQFILTLNAGATLNGGNTESYAANGGGRFTLIRHPHQLNAEILGTLGYAKVGGTNDVEQNAANVIGRLRYDLFLSRMDALFIAIQPRRDTFAGLDLRLQNQVGYLRNLYFPSESHRLWTELGYDLTFDNFAEIESVSVESNPSDLPAPGENQEITRTTRTIVEPDNEIVHSGRIFLGYSNLLHPAANLNLGVETLLDVEHGKNVRVNGTAELTSSLTERFKLGVQFRILFDNVPVSPELKKYDTITAIQLIYTYDSLAGKPAEAPAPAEPACDCTDEVLKAQAACASGQAPALEPVQPVVPEAAPAQDTPASEATTPATTPEEAPAAPAATPAP